MLNDWAPGACHLKGETSMTTTTRGRHVRFAAVALVLGLVAASCGSDDSGSTTGTDDTTSVDTTATDSAAEDTAADTTTDDSASDGGSATATERTNEAGAACTGSGDGSGEPIVIGQIQTNESPGAGFPEFEEGATACFDAINATGGIHGRPIDFTSCNDAGDPVQGETCARDLIDDGAVAVLGGVCFSCFAAPIVDILGEAGIPYVGGLPVLPNEYTQENFYPITNAGGSAALFANAAYIMATAEAEGIEPSVVEIYAAVGEADPTLENQIDKLGGTYLARVGFDPASADLSSIAQQAIDEGSNFVSVQTDGPNTVKLVTSLRTQGFEGGIVILGTAADPQSIEGMGDASEGVFVAAFFDDLANAGSADGEKFRADMEASGGDSTVPLATSGYAAAYVTAEALFAAGDDITSESYLEALTSIGPLEALFAGDMAASNANDDFPRTYYFSAYSQTIQDGVVTPTGDVFNFYTGEPVS